MAKAFQAWQPWLQSLGKAIGEGLGWVRTHPWQSLLYGVILLLVMELSGLGNLLLSRIELWHFALRQQTVQENRSNSRITVVGLDDYSLSHPAIKQLFGRYPFQRAIYGIAIDFFARAEAESLFFDMGFSGGEDLDHPDSDAFFVNRVNAATRLPVFSALVASTEATTAASPAILASLLDWQSVPYPPLAPMLVLPINTIQVPFGHLGQSRMRFVFTNDAYHDDQGRVRYGGLFTTTMAAQQKIAYPTVPMVLALQRQFLEKHKAGAAPTAIDPRFPIPSFTYQPTAPNAPLVWQDKTAASTDPGHFANLYHRTLPIIRWYGDVRGGFSVGGVYQVMEQFGLKDPSQLLGPVGKTLLGNRLRQRMNASQWVYRKSSVYPVHSLWDVIYTQLSDTCPQPQHDAYRRQLCQKFNALKAKGTVEGHYLDPKTFKRQTILLGTNYMNAPGDVHKTIYGGSNYPGVYIVANLLDNLLHNEFVQPAPEWITWVATGLLALLIGWTSYRRPVIYSTVFTLMVLLSYTLLTLWIYQMHNVWLAWALPMLAGGIAFVLSFGVRYWVTEHRKQQLRYAFGKYVSRNVMQTIEANPEAVTLGGQRRRLTFMFTDIRGFTTYSESTPAEQVQAVLTRYFQTMHRIILHDHGGVINKLIGDAIMAYWGFPLEKPADDPVNAVRAALAMRTAMEAWQADPENPPLRIGVGIHTGEAVIGNVGSEEFMDFTVIGDAVNLTSRLEGQTKELLPEQPCAILITETTYDAIKAVIDCRPLGSITVRGKTEPIAIYEPLGETAH